MTRKSLGAVLKASTALKAAVAAETDAVITALTAGIPERIVGEALGGMSQPTVHRMFRHLVGPPPAGWNGTPPDTAVLLRTVTTARTAADKAYTTELQAVANARNDGQTWDQIAAVLGRHPTNVMQAYRRRLTKDAPYEVLPDVVRTRRPGSSGRQLDLHDLLVKYMRWVAERGTSTFLGDEEGAADVFTREELVTLRDCARVATSAGGPPRRS
jgi:hypothetical protein